MGAYPPPSLRMPRASCSSHTPGSGAHGPASSHGAIIATRARALGGEMIDQVMDAAQSPDGASGGTVWCNRTSARRQSVVVMMPIRRSSSTTGNAPIFHCAMRLAA